MAPKSLRSTPTFLWNSVLELELVRRKLRTATCTGYLAKDMKFCLVACRRSALPSSEDVNSAHLWLLAALPQTLAVKGQDLPLQPRTSHCHH